MKYFNDELENTNIKSHFALAGNYSVKFKVKYLK